MERGQILQDNGGGGGVGVGGGEVFAAIGNTEVMDRDLLY